MIDGRGPVPDCLGQNATRGLGHIRHIAIDRGAGTGHHHPCHTGGRVDRIQHISRAFERGDHIIRHRIAPMRGKPRGRVDHYAATLHGLGIGVWRGQIGRVKLERAANLLRHRGEMRGAARVMDVAHGGMDGKALFQQAATYPCPHIAIGAGDENGVRAVGASQRKIGHASYLWFAACDRKVLAKLDPASHH